MRITDSISHYNVPKVQANPEQIPADDIELSRNTYLTHLRQKYTDIRISITDIKDEAQKKELLLSHSGGFHVFLDPELLQKMASDSGIRDKYEGILDQLLEQQQRLRNEAARTGKTIYACSAFLDKDGNASIYTAVTEKKENPVTNIQTGSSADLEADEKKPNSSPIIFQYKYNCSNHLTKLAQARTVSNVRGVIQMQYREMSRARSNIKNKAEAAVTLGRIRNVISKSNIKIARLHKEEALAARCRIAEHKEKNERERLLRQKLKEKRTARKAQEYCDTLDFCNLLDEKAKVDSRSQELLRQEASANAAMDDIVSFMPGSVPTASVPEISVEIEVTATLDVTV